MRRRATYTVADMDASMKQANWLESALEAIPRARVTVFGDFCLDAYWLINPDGSELSVETGLPVRRVWQQRYSLGGASNIVANLAALGVRQIRAVGLLGDDPFGRLMRRMLGELGVDVESLLTGDADWQTAVFVKPLVGDAEHNRLDLGAFNRLTPGTTEELAKHLDRAASASNVVILNQQVPSGISTAEMIERINAVVAAHPDCTFIVDSRHRAELYKNCMLKINAHEAARLAGEPRPLDERIPAEAAKNLAAQLFRRIERAVFLTRGENGVIVATEAGCHLIPGIQIVQRTDPVGAGDTMLSALAAVLASGGRATVAAELANIAASVTVRKLKTTGTASAEEIRQVGPTPDYVYLPELADDPRGARYVEGTEIEIIRDLPRELKIRHAIFDHDGTISTLRQGWEEIMEPMMVRAVLGLRYQDAGEADYHKVVDAVRGFIEKTTGIQTLAQMQGLVEMVRQFGFVDESQILDIHGYKAIYNDALLAMVCRRVEKLHRGELDPADFQIKNSRKFLELLHAAGVKLYLASGTDQEDVAAEAKALGYADLFEGRIFGAVGDVKVEAKRVVLARIFCEHRLGGHEIVTFGDGPVEIRETRKRRGVAVGVASSEIRRFGLCPAKRARLIRAGADLVIPDFSQLDRVLNALKIQ